jgi:hypothetical protein
MTMETIIDIYLNGILPAMGTMCFFIHFGQDDFKEYNFFEKIAYILIFCSIIWPITLVILFMAFLKYITQF